MLEVRVNMEREKHHRIRFNSRVFAGIRNIYCDIVIKTGLYIRQKMGGTGSGLNFFNDNADSCEL